MRRRDLYPLKNGTENRKSTPFLTQAFVYHRSSFDILNLLRQGAAADVGRYIYKSSLAQRSLFREINKEQQRWNAEEWMWPFPNGIKADMH